MNYIYDIEVYRNFFCAVFYCYETGEEEVFEISHRTNQVKALRSFLIQRKINNDNLVGFNIVGFDWPVLTHITKNHFLELNALLASIYKKSKNLIEGFGAKEPELIRQIDLYLIHHFNNVARATSLKVLEYNMGLDDIQDLPYEPNSILSSTQMNELIKYCKYDVLATCKFYEHSISKIKFRERMSETYGLDMTNMSDVAIGEAILLNEIQKQTNWSMSKIKKLRTKRSILNVADIILPIVQFTSRELSDFHAWWLNQSFTETKGQFTDIPLNNVQSIFHYTNQVTRKKNTVLAKLNIVYKGFQFDFGTGGIHGAKGSGVWKETDTHELILVDVNKLAS